MKLLIAVVLLAFLIAPVSAQLANQTNQTQENVNYLCSKTNLQYTYQKQCSDFCKTQNGLPDPTDCKPVPQFNVDFGVILSAISLCCGTTFMILGIMAVVLVKAGIITLGGGQPCELSFPKPVEYKNERWGAMHVSGRYPGPGPDKRPYAVGSLISIDKKKRKGIETNAVIVDFLSVANESSSLLVLDKSDELANAIDENGKLKRALTAIYKELRDTQTERFDSVRAISEKLKNIAENVRATIVNTSGSGGKTVIPPDVGEPKGE